MLEREDAINIANEFFQKKNGTYITRLLEAPTHWICYGGPAGRIVGKMGIKIEKMTGKVDKFILPNEENFALLDKAVKIEI